MHRGTAVNTFEDTIEYLGYHGEVPWVFWCIEHENAIGLSTYVDIDDIGFIAVL